MNRRLLLALLVAPVGILRWLPRERGTRPAELANMLRAVYNREGFIGHYEYGIMTELLDSLEAVPNGGD